MNRILFESFIIFCAFWGTVAHADEFPPIARLSDIPLPPGMIIVSQPSVSQEISEGLPQILVARGTLSENALRQFYRDTLPMKGWRPVTSHQFIRNWDQIDLTIETIAGGRFLTLHLGPAPLRP